MIEVPQHGSMPSGHATEGHVIAGILTALVPGANSNSSAAIYLRRAAWRIAANRVVAGLHFPVDNIAGRLLGDALGQYILALCGQTANVQCVGFDGASLNPISVATDKAGPDDPMFWGIGCKTPVSLPAGACVKALPILKKMWELAAEEWKY